MLRYAESSFFKLLPCDRVDCLARCVVQNDADRVLLLLVDLRVGLLPLSHGFSLVSSRAIPHIGGATALIDYFLADGTIARPSRSVKCLKA